MKDDASLLAETIDVTEKQPTHVKLPHARSIVLALVLTLMVTAPVAGDTDAPDPTLDPSGRFDPAAYIVGWLTADRDGDGTVDYAVRVDDSGNKLREAMDYNLDGRMDDFYFYANDVLQRQEVDSNFDEAIDVWVYMWRGVYVQRWERDTDFDGAVDLIRDYDQSQ